MYVTFLGRNVKNTHPCDIRTVIRGCINKYIFIMWPVSLLPFTSLTPSDSLLPGKILRAKIYALSLLYSFNLTQSGQITAILSQSYVIRINDVVRI